jgi:RimJ/RimL family protein N-acetyltransferase
VKEYKCLSKQTYSLYEYQIVPIRDQDRYDIMQWRNEQMYHLRQSKPLDKESQDKYFDTVITKLFEIVNPDQILFSYLENGICIGYGGLVHINWIDKNAEISFIMNTDLEEKYFKKHWNIFLNLLESVAFGNIQLHKIYTYAYNIRPKLFAILKASNYTNEAILHEHVLINNVYEDVLIHAKINKPN